MDITRRKITKIAREVSRFSAGILRKEGIGASEYDFLHAVRKNPGINQAKVREMLSLDKGAAARIAKNLETKGFLIRKNHPEDKRSQQLFATEKADLLKNSRASIEAKYYEWLWQEFSEEELHQFSALLDRVYQKNKEESLAGFGHVKDFVEGKSENEKEH